MYLMIDNYILISPRKHFTVWVSFFDLILGDTNPLYSQKPSIFIVFSRSSTGFFRFVIVPVRCVDFRGAAVVLEALKKYLFCFRLVLR